MDNNDKPPDKSLFNSFLLNMRNLRLHQHCEEAMGRFTVRSKRGRTLGEVLGAGSDEEIGKYFLEAIPELIPIVYLRCWEHFYLTRSLSQFYYHHAVKDATHVKSCSLDLGKDRYLNNDPDHLLQDPCPRPLIGRGHSGDIQGISWTQ